MGGLHTHNIKMDIDDGVLGIRATRPTTRVCQRFVDTQTISKRFRVDRHLGPRRVSASYVNSVLTITLPQLGYEKEQTSERNADQTARHRGDTQGSCRDSQCQYSQQA